jgi:hypothetical protein
MLLKIVLGKLWGKQSCPEGAERPEMPVPCTFPTPPTAPKDRIAQPLVRRSGLSAAWARRPPHRIRLGFLPTGMMANSFLASLPP